MSSHPKTLTVPNDPSNLHRLAVLQHYHNHVRRGSVGNLPQSPCEAILRYGWSEWGTEDGHQGYVGEGRGSQK